MTAVPPPIGPNLHQWAQSTRAWLQRYLPRLQWFTADSNASENGTILWDEDAGYPVVSLAGAWRQLPYRDEVLEIIDHYVIVKEAADLSGVLDSTKLYLIDGIIDMGSQSIEVPEGGLTIAGSGAEICGLTSSVASHDLFTSPAGGYSGSLRLSSMFVTTSGAGSRTFNLDGAGNISGVECRDFRFTSCQDLGVLDSMSQGLFSGVTFFDCVDGVEMEGAWTGGFAILTAIIIAPNTDFTGTLLKAGAALTVAGSVRMNLNALQLHSTGEISDFAPANITNDAGFRMENVRCNPASTPLPNFPATSVKAKYSGCEGFRDTYIGGSWSVATEAATTVTPADTLVKVAGVVSYSDLNHFAGDNDNELKYIGSNNISVQCGVSGSFTGPNNAECVFVFRKYDDSAAAYTDLSESGEITAASASKPLPISLQAFADLDQDDRIELWVKIVGGTGDVTLKQGGIVFSGIRAN